MRLFLWLLLHSSGGACPLHTVGLAVVLAQYPTDTALVVAAIVKTETDVVHNSRSKAGACCYGHVLGGRYPNPSCSALEQDTALCIARVVHWLEYWRSFCGAAYLDAYHGGWGKCKAGWWYAKHKDDPGVDWCVGEACTSYGNKVVRWKKRIVSYLTK